MIVRSPSGEYEMIDFRERAPAAAFQGMYNNNTDASLYGGLASGIPGELRGLEYLHSVYGKLPWAALVEPSISLAKNGFTITEEFVYYMNSTTPSNAFLYEDPAWAIDFAPQGKLLEVGDVMTRNRYANTLATIARCGPEAFYTGLIANATISTLRSSGGIMTLRDLRNYTAIIRKPIAINYHGFKVFSTSAPSSGAVVLGVLKTVEGYSMGDLNALNLTTHLLDEAIRFGYGEVPSLHSLRLKPD
jgi:gamma-glutamyltranspeptidase / glutathione hydrolase